MEIIFGKQVVQIDLPKTLAKMKKKLTKQINKLEDREIIILVKSKDLFLLEECNFKEVYDLVKRKEKPIQIHIFILKDYLLNLQFELEKSRNQEEIKHTTQEKQIAKINNNIKNTHIPQNLQKKVSSEQEGSSQLSTQVQSYNIQEKIQIQSIIKPYQSDVQVESIYQEQIEYNLDDLRQNYDTVMMSLSPNCNYCSQKVQINSFISNCGHMFHSECIKQIVLTQIIKVQLIQNVNVIQECIVLIKLLQNQDYKNIGNSFYQIKLKFQRKDIKIQDTARIRIVNFLQQQIKKMVYLHTVLHVRAQLSQENEFEYKNYYKKMIQSERDYLNVKGKQFQRVHSKRVCSPNVSLISVNHNTSLPQLKLQAKQLLAQSIHKDISGALPFNQIHLKPLICKNKSCIYLVRNLEDKIAKYIIKIKEITKENSILRKKLQMDRLMIDSQILSTHRSQKSLDLKQLTEEIQYPRSNFISLHDAHQITKFSNEVCIANLTQKWTFDIFNNLSMLLQQPFLDINWSRPIIQSNPQLQANQCLKNCQNNVQTDLIELHCNHIYHKNCLCEEIINSSKQQISTCQCNQQLNKNDKEQLNEVQRAIIKQIKLNSQLSQLIKKQDQFTFYKCEQSVCSFIIINQDFENLLSVQSFCQSCLNIRLFYKKEQIEK